jgi:hypothetical protein
LKDLSEIWVECPFQIGEGFRITQKGLASVGLRRGTTLTVLDVSYRSDDPSLTGSLRWLLKLQKRDGQVYENVSAWWGCQHNRGAA